MSTEEVVLELEAVSNCQIRLLFQKVTCELCLACVKEFEVGKCKQITVKRK